MKHSLLNSDIYGYDWSPRFWFRWKRRWGHPKKPICGCDFRLWWLGGAMSFDGAGRFHNGSRWIILFRYDREREEMLGWWL